MKKLILAAILAPLWLAVSIVCADSNDPEFFPITGVEEGRLPFSEAVRAGPFLYVSGMIGTLPDSMELAPGGIQPETRTTMENIKRVVERHGTSMNRVVKCTVFLADIAEWAAMNEVYVEFFPNHKPARSALGASGLALDARVEIECIAVVGD